MLHWWEAVDHELVETGSGDRARTAAKDEAAGAAADDAEAAAGDVPAAAIEATCAIPAVAGDRAATETSGGGVHCRSGVELPTATREGRALTPGRAAATALVGSQVLPCNSTNLPAVLAAAQARFGGCFGGRCGAASGASRTPSEPGKPTLVATQGLRTPASL